MSIRSHETPSELISEAVLEFAVLAKALLREKNQIKVLLTGGTLGIEFIAGLAKLDLDWTRFWFKFSDERFVGLDDPDRNEHQGLVAWPALELQLDRYPAVELELAQARELENQKLLERFGSVDEAGVIFDLAILGMGPDAHIASLFPGHNQDGEWVIAEPDSPKPPSQRLSFSYGALNRSERVWFLAAGDSKLTAAKQSLDQSSGLPASRVRGLSETVWYLDKEITDAL